MSDVPVTRKDLDNLRREIQPKGRPSAYTVANYTASNAAARGMLGGVSSYNMGKQQSQLTKWIGEKYIGEHKRMFGDFDWTSTDPTVLAA